MKHIFIIFLVLSFYANGQMINNSYSDHKKEESIGFLLSPVFTKFRFDKKYDTHYLLGLVYNHSLKKSIFVSLGMLYENRRYFTDDLDDTSRRCLAQCIYIYENNLFKSDIINMSIYLKYKHSLIKHKLLFELIGGVENSAIVKTVFEGKLSGLDSVSVIKNSSVRFGTSYLIGGIALKYVINKNINISIQPVFRYNINFFPANLTDRYNYNIRLLLTYQLK